MAIITFLTPRHRLPLPLHCEISLSLTSISLLGQAVIVLIVSYSLGPDLLSWPWMIEEREWGGVYCHPDGPQYGRFAQGPSMAAPTSPPTTSNIIHGVAPLCGWLIRPSLWTALVTCLKETPKKLHSVQMVVEKCIALSLFSLFSLALSLFLEEQNPFKLLKALWRTQQYNVY